MGRILCLSVSLSSLPASIIFPFPSQTNNYLKGSLVND